MVVGFALYSFVSGGLGWKGAHLWVERERERWLPGSFEDEDIVNPSHDFCNQNPGKAWKSQAMLMFRLNMHTFSGYPRIVS